MRAVSSSWLDGDVDVVNSRCCVVSFVSCRVVSGEKRISRNQSRRQDLVRGKRDGVQRENRARSLQRQRQRQRQRQSSQSVPGRRGDGKRRCSSGNAPVTGRPSVGYRAQHSRLEGKSRGLRRHGTHCRCSGGAGSRQLNWSRNRGSASSIGSGARGGECVVDDAPAGQWPDGAKGLEGQRAGRGAEAGSTRGADAEMQMEDLEALRAAQRGSCPLLLGVVYLRVAPFRCVIPVAYFSVLCSTLSGHPPVRGAGRAGGWGRLGGLGPGAAAPEPPGTGSHFFPCCWNLRLFKLSGTETRLHSTSPSSSSPQQRCLLVANNELTLETLGAPFYLRTWTAKGKRHHG